MSSLPRADGGRLRSGWRVCIVLASALVFTLAVSNAVALALAVGLSLAGRSVAPGDMHSAPFLAAQAVGTGLCIPVIFLFWRFLDRRPVRSLGFGKAGRETRLWLIGLAGGAGLILLMVGMVAALGGLRLGAPPSTGIGMAFIYALILLVPALWEEVLVRGYVLTNIEEGVGAVHGVVLSSLIFAAFHLLNPGQEGMLRLLVAANIFLAGVLLGIVYLRTRSLPAVWGIHFGWNSFLGPVFGIPVSGVRMEPLVPVSVHLAPQIGGGDFGLEGGIICTAVVSAAVVAVWGLIPTSRTP